MLGYSLPRGKLHRTVRPATSRARCSLRQDPSRLALPRDLYLPAPTRLSFCVCAYHLESRCVSAAGLDCTGLLRAAMDIARDVRCELCATGGIDTAEGLHAVYLSTPRAPGA